MREVDYLIVGAGMSGTVLHHFLQSDSKVILDPSPGGFKIGESITPEHFHHPVMRELGPLCRELPSYSPKVGTTFISGDSVASFPLPAFGAEVSMHVAREELEPLMHREWKTPILRERVIDIVLPEKIVKTDQGEFHVRKQIFDCSGPAMVVARKCSNIQKLWPVWARWAYLDIEQVNNEKFMQDITKRDLSYLRYDVPTGVVLPSGEDDGWEASSSTILTEIEQGKWLWQIPLFHKTMLSVGLVSRHAKPTDEDLFSAIEAHQSPIYDLKRRKISEGDGESSNFDRVWSRSGFAVKAETSATMDYVLLGDACAFADPIYSVGTALAVNKAIELAGIINEEGWSAAACERWCSEYDTLIQRAVEAFELWYNGDVLRDNAAAKAVNESFLTGTAFQVGIAQHYSRMLMDAGERDGTHRRHAVEAGRKPLTDRVGRLLGLEADQTIAGWTFVGAYGGSAELQIRFEHPDKPMLVSVVSFDPEITRYYRRVGEISLSFLNLREGPYPMDDGVGALFDEIERCVQGSESAWKDLPLD
ncbi:MAG: tryptophan 7-halogenase [Deltaproteobacteria bacterium]|nr:tryptophan 7-halogenase [Deltaproteobacteria bacterium]